MQLPNDTENIGTRIEKAPEIDPTLKHATINVQLFDID